MFTAMDVYEAYLAGQEWQRSELRKMGTPTFKPAEWGQLPALEKRKYEIMAERLNQQIAAEKEEKGEIWVP